MIALVVGAALLLILGILRVVGEKRGNTVLAVAGILLGLGGLLWQELQDQ